MTIETSSRMRLRLNHHEAKTLKTPIRSRISTSCPPLP